MAKSRILTCLRKPLPATLLLLTCAYAGLASGAVGYVDRASGDVSVQSTNASLKLNTGDALNVGSTIRTSKSGRVTIKMQNAQTLMLPPDSELHVDRYEADPRDPSAGISVARLSQGAVRVVAGETGTANGGGDLRLTAGDATIELRRSDATVMVDSRTQTTRAGVTTGAISLQTSFGTMWVGPGQYSTFEPGRAPSAPRPVVAAPADVHATFVALKFMSEDPQHDEDPDHHHGPRCHHHHHHHPPHHWIWGEGPDIAESPSAECCHGSDC